VDCPGAAPPAGRLMPVSLSWLSTTGEPEMPRQRP